MFYIYFYDLRPKNPKDYNRLKRKFYYHLNKLNLDTNYWRTRSVLIVPPEIEAILDEFFLSFKPDVEVYKAQTKYVEEL